MEVDDPTYPVTGLRRTFERAKRRRYPVRLPVEASHVADPKAGLRSTTLWPYEYSSRCHH